MSYLSYDQWLEAKYDEYLENGDVTEAALAEMTLAALNAIDDIVVEEMTDFMNEEPEHYGSW